MMFDQTIEQRFFRCPPHQAEFQRCQILQASFDNRSVNIGNAGALATNEWIVRNDFERRQLNVSATVQRQH